VGGVSINDKGYIIRIHVDCLGTENNNAVELHALVTFLFIATKEGYNKIVVEGDSHVITLMLKRLQQISGIRKINNYCHLEGGLEHLKAIVPTIEVILPSHVRRSTNKIVDRLSDEGINCSKDMMNKCWTPYVEDSLTNDYRELAKADQPTPDWVVERQHKTFNTVMQLVSIDTQLRGTS
jgi:ribonuclease HI